jgi:hypothetical protein
MIALLHATMWAAQEKPKVQNPSNVQAQKQGTVKKPIKKNRFKGDWVVPVLVPRVQKSSLGEN